LEGLLAALAAREREREARSQVGARATGLDRAAAGGGPEEPDGTSALDQALDARVAGRGGKRAWAVGSIAGHRAVACSLTARRRAGREACRARLTASCRRLQVADAVPVAGQTRANVGELCAAIGGDAVDRRAAAVLDALPARVVARAGRAGEGEGSVGRGAAAGVGERRTAAARDERAHRDEPPRESPRPDAHGRTLALGVLPTARIARTPGAPRRGDFFFLASLASWRLFFDRCRDRVESLVPSMAEEGDRLEPLGPSLAKLGDRLDQLEPSLAKLGDRLDQLGPSLAKLGDRLDQLGPSLAKLGDRLDQLEPSLAKLGDRLEPLGHSISKEDDLRSLNGAVVSPVRHDRPDSSHLAALSARRR